MALPCLNPWPRCAPAPVIWVLSVRISCIKFIVFPFADTLSPALPLALLPILLLRHGGVAAMVGKRLSGIDKTIDTLKRQTPSNAVYVKPTGNRDDNRIQQKWRKQNRRFRLDADCISVMNKSSCRQSGTHWNSLFPPVPRFDTFFFSIFFSAFVAFSCIERHY